MHQHEVITHIHTTASSGDASALNPLITTAIKNTLGSNFHAHWKECFITCEDIKNLIDEERKVKLIFITDHVNEKSHNLSPESIELACSDSRIALGVEVQTWFRKDSKLIRAPEVLIYGRTKKNTCKAGSYYGISQEDLNILFEECCLDSSGKADIFMVKDFCQLGGYAYALAHPFDGNEVELEDIVDIITQFKFVETINGGFPADSSKRISLFISWFNRAGMGLIPKKEINSPILRKLYDRAITRGQIHPWGGSDAHIKNHDRVVIIYRTDNPEPVAGDFIKDMIEYDVASLLARKTFLIRGTSATPISLLDDVARISYRNIRNHWEELKSTSKLIDAIENAGRIIAKELMERRVHRKKLLKQFDATIGNEIRLWFIEFLKKEMSEDFEKKLSREISPQRMP